MKWALAATAVFLTGLLMFYAHADFSNYYWKSFYYLWDKGKDVVFFACIWNGFRQLRKVTIYPLVFAIIRLAWEIAATLFQLDINERKAVNIYFLILIAIFLLLLLKDLKKWRQ